MGSKWAGNRHQRSLTERARRAKRTVPRVAGQSPLPDAVGRDGAATHIFPAEPRLGLSALRACRVRPAALHIQNSVASSAARAPAAAVLIAVPAKLARAAPAANNVLALRHPHGPVAEAPRLFKILARRAAFICEHARVLSAAAVRLLEPGLDALAPAPRATEALAAARLDEPIGARLAKQTGSIRGSIICTSAPAVPALAAQTHGSPMTAAAALGTSSGVAAACVLLAKLAWQTAAAGTAPRAAGAAPIQRRQCGHCVRLPLPHCHCRALQCGRPAGRRPSNPLRSGCKLISGGSSCLDRCRDCGRCMRARPKCKHCRGNSLRVRCFVLWLRKKHRVRLRISIRRQRPAWLAQLSGSPAHGCCT